MQRLQDKDHAFWQARAKKVRIETGLFIDGVYDNGLDNGQDDQFFETINPATGEVIANMSAASAQDVDRAVGVAKQAFSSGVWSRLAPRTRMDILFRFADLVEADAADLAVLESLDMGKPISRVLSADIPSVLSTIRFFAECIDKIESGVTNTEPGSFHYLLREPLGVVAAITPWNFPMVIAMWKIAPALAAGNTVILKPAEQSPLTGLRLAELFLKAGGPAGVFNVLNGPGEITGKALALHNDVAKIAFTGSTQVGRLMLMYAQSNLKKVSLECGGKSPQIIFADTPDLDETVNAAVAGIYANSGQVCSAGSRLLVQRSIHREFVEKFVAAARTAFVPGDPLDPATTLGPMVTSRHKAGVDRYIKTGISEGGVCVMGGDTPKHLSAGAYVMPTLFDGITPEMTIAREEVFGPVAGITPFDDEDEAVSIANDSIYGLAASVWTQNLSRAHRLSRDIEAGVVWVNCYGDGDMTQPFGGYKQSGQGRDRGTVSLLSYTQLKSVWMKL